VITIFVVLLAVFFDFRMPTVENKKLKTEIADQREISAYQDRFAVRYEAISKLLDSINKNPAIAETWYPKINADIAKLTELNIFKENDITPSARMYGIVVNNLLKIQDLLKKNAAMNTNYKDLQKKYEGLLQNQTASPLSQ
jgi:hypothetical protein